MDWSATRRAVHERRRSACGKFLPSCLLEVACCALHTRLKTRRTCFSGGGGAKRRIYHARDMFTRAPWSVVAASFVDGRKRAGGAAKVRGQSVLRDARAPGNLRVH